MILTKHWKTMPGFAGENRPTVRRRLWKYGQALLNAKHHPLWSPRYNYWNRQAYKHILKLAKEAP